MTCVLKLLPYPFSVPQPESEDVSCATTFTASKKEYCITSKYANPIKSVASAQCEALGYKLVFFSDEEEWNAFNDALPAGSE